MNRGWFDQEKTIPVVEANSRAQGLIPFIDLARMAGVPQAVGTVFHLIFTGKSGKIESEHSARIVGQNNVSLDFSDVIRSGHKIIPG